MTAVCVGTISSLAQTPPEQVEAYVRVIKAEQAEKQGDLAGAEQHYAEALKLYRQVGRENPKWRPDLVQYRISHCLNQVERLRNMQRNAVEIPAAVPAVKQIDAAPEAMASERAELMAKHDALLARTGELEQLRIKDQETIQSLEKALETASASLEGNTELKKLRESNRELEKEIRQREKSLRDLAADLEKRDAQSAREEKARKETMLGLERELAEARAGNDQLQQKVAELEGRIVPEKQRLAALAASEKMAADNAELQRVVTGQAETIAHLNDQMAAAKQAGEKSRAELQAERDRLNGEIAALKETVDLNLDEVRKVKELRAKIKTLEKEIVPEDQRLAALAEREKMAADNADLKRVVAGQTETIAHLNDQVAAAKQAGEKAQAEFQTEKDRLSGDVASLKETVDLNLEEIRKVNELRARIKALEKEIVPEDQRLAAQAERADLIERIKTLQQSAAEQKEQVGHIRQQLAESEKEKVSNQNRFDAEKNKLEKEKAALRENIESNRAELKKNREWKARVDSLEKEKVSLVTRLQEMQDSTAGEKIRMEEEIKRLLSQNTVLVEEVQQFRDRLEKAERRLREFERLNAGIPPN